MPFNVRDKNGNYLGFMAATYPQYFNVFMAAVTTEKIDDHQIDMSSMKDRIAGLYGCKNILGKVNNEKFEKTIENLLESDYSRYKDLGSTDFLKLLALKNLADVREYIDYNKECVRGYVLIDIDKLHLEDGTAIIDETIDYIYNCAADKDAPIYGKIIDDPIICTDIMGVGEGLLLGADFSDFGGRNHAHTTILNVLSGNFITKISLPIIIYAKKDMTVKLYLSSDKIKKIFCDGIIYKF